MIKKVYEGSIISRFKYQSLESNDKIDSSKNLLSSVLQMQH